MKTNVKPCAKCGGKLRPVKGEDGAINALYCDDCRTIHTLNGEYGNPKATIEWYNRVYTEQTGANDER